MQNPISLLHGPPGTGKTSTLVVLLFGLIEKRMRVVFVAPTNHAAKDCARRFDKLLRSFEQDVIGMHDYVLLGNEEQLKLKNDPLASKLFVDNKVKNLIRQSKSCLGTLVDFLPLLCFPLTSDIILVLQHSGNAWKSYKSDFLLKMERFMECLEFFKRFQEYPREFWCFHDVEWDCDSKWTLFTDLKEVLDSVDNLYSKNPNHFLQMMSNFEMNQNSPFSFYDKMLVTKLRQVSVFSRQTASMLKNLLSLNEMDMKKVLIESARITFSTVSSSYRNPLYSKRNCVVVVDEAAQVCEAETLIILQYPNVRSIVLAGDEMQLSATVISKDCSANGYGRSLFERLKIIGLSSDLLDIQYRMHPKIVEFSNHAFYSGKLRSPPEMEENREAEWHQKEYFGALRLINVPDGQETFDTRASSYTNQMETKLLYTMLKRLIKEFPEVNASIGIITFYQSQKLLIEELLLKYGKLIDGVLYIGQLKITVNTVDGFQGQEQDIIIISSVRSNFEGRLGFLSNSQRLNVALTRAKYSLWVLVNEKTMSKDPFWDSLIQFSKEKKCFVSAMKETHMKSNIVVSNVQAIVKDAAEVGTKISDDDSWFCIMTKKAKNAVEKMTQRQQQIFTERVSLMGQGRLKDRKYVANDTYDIFSIKVDDVFILWRVDLEATKDYYQQVICIWDIASGSSVAQSVKDIVHVLESRTEEYLVKSKENGPKSCTKNLIFPRTYFKSEGKILFYKDKRVAEVHNDEESNITDLVKVYHLNAYMIAFIRKGILKSVELPLVLGQEEVELLEKPESLFILGRSGTGKTTVMLAKMLVTEETGIVIQKLEESNMSQWLVTCNQKLKENTEKYYLKLRNSSPSLKDKIPPQFFVFRDLLEYLDSILPDKFFRVDSNELFDMEDDGERDFRSSRFKKSRYVSAERFIESYYVRFDQGIQKKYSASFIWTQVQVYIFY
jgi:DNA replication protein DnaC